MAYGYGSYGHGVDRLGGDTATYDGGVTQDKEYQCHTHHGYDAWLGNLGRGRRASVCR